MLKTNFSLDPATSLANRAQIASYVVAWGQARTRIKAQAEAEANNEIRDWTDWTKTFRCENIWL